MSTRAKCSPLRPEGEARARSAGAGAGEGGESESGFEDGRRDRCGVSPDPGGGTRAGVEEALARAGRHGRAATAEAVAAVRALLDAGSLGVSGEPSEAHAGLAALAKRLDEMAASLNGEPKDPSPSPLRTLLNALVDALDAEVRRWEVRSNGDPHARTVLRSFLALREILWEFGLRRTAEGQTETLRRRSAEAHGPTPEGGANRTGEDRKHLAPKPLGGGRRRIPRVKVQDDNDGSEEDRGDSATSPALLRSTHARAASENSPYKESPRQ